MGSNLTQPTIFLHNNIICKYIQFNSIHLAHQLFDKIPHRNVVSYNTMISAYCRKGYVESALKLFFHMRACGLWPTQFTFGALLSCHSVEVVCGLQLQALLDKSGLLFIDAFAGTSLLGMFGRHGLLDEAVGVFESLPIKSLVTWNCMISTFAQHGHVQESFLMFREVIRCGLGLSESTFLGVLSGFVDDLDLDLGEQVHGILIKCRLHDVIPVANSLINMYAKCSGTNMAEKMFDVVCVKDVVSWNIIVGALAKSDRPEKSIKTFLQMCVHSNVLPNETTFVSVINSCTGLQNVLCAEYIHAKIIRKGLDSDVYVGSALVDFYAKCKRLVDAHFCFSEIFEKNLVCWNSLILGYSNQGSSVSLLLLKEMMQCTYLPNEFSFSGVLKSSLGFELVQLHSLIIRFGYNENEYVRSSLIASYARNGLISDALVFADSCDTSSSVVESNVIAGIYNRTREFYKTQELFALLEEPDIISWNILIAACSRIGDHKEAFELFEHMQKFKLRPDNYTYVSLLSVCTQLCNLALGSSLHGLIIKTDFSRCDTFVCNILLDMYGKCGSLTSSVKIFDEMVNRNLISWTAIVSALGLHGYGHEAILKFREMEFNGFKPDKVAFIAVLSACRYGGLVKEGMEIFEQMKSKYGIELEMEHYHNAVDLLARYGHLREAEELISQMPFPPNAMIWRSFLEGCKKKRTSETLAIAV